MVESWTLQATRRFCPSRIKRKWHLETHASRSVKELRRTTTRCRSTSYGEAKRSVSAGSLSALKQRHTARMVESKTVGQNTPTQSGIASTEKGAISCSECEQTIALRPRRSNRGVTIDAAIVIRLTAQFRGSPPPTLVVVARVGRQHRRQKCRRVCALRSTRHESRTRFAGTLMTCPPELASHIASIVFSTERLHGSGLRFQELKIQFSIRMPKGPVILLFRVPAVCGFAPLNPPAGSHRLTLGIIACRCFCLPARIF